MGSSLRHAGSFVAVCGLFIMARGLLSSCGVQVFLSLVVVRGLCSLRHLGSLVVAHGLSCPVACGS